MLNVHGGTKCLKPNLNRVDFTLLIFMLRGSKDLKYFTYLHICHKADNYSPNIAGI